MHQFGMKTALGGLKARFAFATTAAVLLASCVVYTPDLLNDDAVSLGGGGLQAGPGQTPASAPPLQLRWAAASNETDPNFAALAEELEVDAGPEADGGQNEDGGNPPSDD
jgi:hypothetical protein